VFITGEYCETKIPFCTKEYNPCRNGARCVDHFTHYTCECVVGYSGENCTINVDDCQNNMCQVRGLVSNMFVVHAVKLQERRQPPKTQYFDFYHPMAHPDTRPVSFTYLPVASIWVVTLHNLCPYSDPPLHCHPPSYWLRLFSSQTFSRINTPTFSIPVILHPYPPMKMEQTECSEMLAYKIQMLGNYPEESMQQMLFNFKIVC